MPLNITHKGETHTLNRWAKILDVCAATLYTRYNKGVRGDELFTRKSRRGHTFPSRHRVNLATASQGRAPNLLIQKHKKEVDAWRNMLHHCYSPHSKAYPLYGGKGIGVCQEWRDSFEQFLKDVGQRPVGHYCLGRYDRSLDYSPANTAWMPRTHTHKGNSVLPLLVPYQGQQLTFTDLAKLSGLTPNCIRARYSKGKRELELTAPLANASRMPRHHVFDHMGRQVTFLDLSRETGLDYGTLYNRYHKGDRDAKLVRPSRQSRK